MMGIPRKPPMNDNFDYITVNMMLPLGGDIICLVSYQSEGHLFSIPSAIKKLTLLEGNCYNKTLFSTNLTLSNISVSSSGTIWAVDNYGHLHSSKPTLNGEKRYKELETTSFALDWSFQSLPEGMPVCIIGEDDDLWIATYEGDLIHYNGKDFTMYPGIEMPIRFKEVDGQYFLMGYRGQLMQCIDGHWESIRFDSSVPADLPINDLTSLNGRLIAVSSLGFILSQQDDATFSLMLSVPRISWFGCDTLQGVVYLAGGKHGAYKLVKGGVVSIKHKDPMVGVKVIGNEVMFLLASTLHGEFVRYKPFDKGRWGLMKTSIQVE